MKPILDSLTAIGVVAATYDHTELFTDLVETFYEIFTRAYNTEFQTPNDRTIHFSPTWVWKEIIIRVYSLGAFLIKRKLFVWIPILIRQEITWDEYWKPFYWSRYILVMASRERRLEKGSLCTLAVEYVKNNPNIWLHFMENEEEVINKTCQFDFIQGIHVLHNGKDPYPSFGIYYEHRTEPIVVQLVQGGSVRDAIPVMSNGELAKILIELNRLASTQFFTYAGWETFHDATIKEFLNKYAD